MSASPDIFRTNLQIRLDQLGWNRTRLADELKISKQNVSQWFSDRTPSLETIDEIAAVTKVSTAWLLTDHEQGDLFGQIKQREQAELRACRAIERIAEDVHALVSKMNLHRRAAPRE